MRGRLGGIGDHGSSPRVRERRARHKVAEPGPECYPGRVLRVSRTIADLDGSDSVRAPHIAEALHGSQLAAENGTSTST
jgi:hypothetical protein